MERDAEVQRAGRSHRTVSGIHASCYFLFNLDYKDLGVVNERTGSSLRQSCGNTAVLSVVGEAVQ